MKNKYHILTEEPMNELLKLLQKILELFHEKQIHYI